MKKIAVLILVLLTFFLFGRSHKTSLDQAIKQSNIPQENILYIYKLIDNAIVFDLRVLPNNNQKVLGYNLFRKDINENWSLIDSGAQPELISRSNLTYDSITLSGIKDSPNGFIYGVIVNKDIDKIIVNNKFRAHIVSSKSGVKIWFLLIEPYLMQVPGLEIIGLSKEGIELYHFPPPK